VSERWPAMMKRKTAAAYCDLTEPAFEREILAGRLPAGVKFGGHEHWHRQALDTCIDRIVGNVVPDYRQKLRDRYGANA
jgi:hypothetical protein